MEHIEKLFNNDAFAKQCGIQIVEYHHGYAHCTMEVTECHLNGIGTLMGGALFTLADFTFCVAANSHGPLAVSLQVSISYLRPCSSGKVTAIATEISRSSRIGVYRIAVSDEHGVLLADVSATCYFKRS
ncbi:MAG TPA: PaaI family thioesterase [Bacteroidota bacterium]|nr:PaaI family thioesterase [Bacteroidota bacterium]